MKKPWQKVLVSENLYRTFRACICAGKITNFGPMETRRTHRRRSCIRWQKSWQQGAPGLFCGGSFAASCISARMTRDRSGSQEAAGGASRIPRPLCWSHLQISSWCESQILYVCKYSAASGSQVEGQPFIATMRCEMWKLQRLDAPWSFWRSRWGE